MKYDNKTIIKKFKEVHANRYKYGNVLYVNNKVNVDIECRRHGIFSQRPAHHQEGKGCPECASIHKTSKQFVSESIKIHKKRYGYGKVNYINNRTHVIINCKDHGDFPQRPFHHLSGGNCPKCSHDNKRSNLNDFISKSEKIHNKRYGYKKVVYVDNKTKVIINCEKHGDFLQTPKGHLEYKGCGKCRHSKGEIRISNYLDNHKIKYETEKKFEGCVSIKKLRYDFYIPKYNILIEYQGIQHYRSNERYADLVNTQKRDHIKLKFANKYLINYLVIKYNKFIFIEDILTQYISKIKRSTKI